MHTIQLIRKGQAQEIAGPSNWNELSRKQLLYIAKHWESWKIVAKDKRSLIKTKCALFLQLFPDFTFSKQKKFIPNLSDEKLFELAELTNFVFEKNTLTACPIPSIGKLKKLYAPNDKLGGIIGFEFTFADDSFLKYLESNNISDLERMIGSMYHPRKWFSAERVDFNKNKIKKYAKTAAKLSYAEKQLILLWYYGCRQHIVESNPEVFSNENQDKAKNTGWLPVILALSGNKFGTFEQTGYTPFHLILMELREAKERNKPVKK